MFAFLASVIPAPEPNPEVVLVALAFVIFAIGYFLGSFVRSKNRTSESKEPTAEPVAVEEKSELYYIKIVSPSGNVLFEGEVEDIEIDYDDDGYVEYKTNGKSGYINPGNNLIIIKEL